MSAIAALERLRAALAAALPQAAVVAVHTQDLSDVHTGKWLVRLPGVYLVCEGIDATAPDEATIRLRVFVIVRMADVRENRAQAGWAMAEGALAVVIADPVVERARLVYRDQSGIDQAGIGLWEIDAQARHVLPAATPEEPTTCIKHLQYEEIYSSWAPWIGAAHEPKYERVTGAPSAGNVDAEELLP